MKIFVFAVSNEKTNEMIIKYQTYSCECDVVTIKGMVRLISNDQIYDNIISCCNGSREEKYEMLLPTKILLAKQTIAKSAINKEIIPLPSLPHIFVVKIMIPKLSTNKAKRVVKVCKTVRTFIYKLK